MKIVKWPDTRFNNSHKKLYTTFIFKYKIHLKIRILKKVELDTYIKKIIYYLHIYIREEPELDAIFFNDHGERNNLTFFS
jgi:hypothetical protein